MVVCVEVHSLTQTHADYNHLQASVSMSTDNSPELGLQQQKSDVGLTGTDQSSLPHVHVICAWGCCLICAVKREVASHLIQPTSQEVMPLILTPLQASTTARLSV